MPMLMILFGFFLFIRQWAYIRQGVIHGEMFLLGKWWAYSRRGLFSEFYGSSHAGHNI